MLLCPTVEHLHRQIAFCAILSLVGIQLFQFNSISTHSDGRMSHMYTVGTINDDLIQAACV